MEIPGLRERSREIAHGSPSRVAGLGPNLAAGSVSALLTLSYGLSYGTLIFSGTELLPHLAVGLQSALVATWLTALVVALGSSFRFSIAGADSNATVGLALIAVSVSSILAAEGIVDERLGATVLLALMVSAVATRLLVLLLGLFSSGRLVRFIPFPVVGGFLAGTGYLITSGGLKVLTGKALDWEWVTAPPHVPLLGWLIAGAVAVASLVIPRFSNHYLVVPGVIVAGTLLFYIGLHLSAMDVATARAHGLMFNPLGPAPAVPPSTAMLSLARWDVILSQWQNLLATTVIVVITILLNATGVELATRHDVDFDRELRVNGIANILSGLSGGMIGYLSVSRTFLNFKAGARARGAAIWTALLCVAATYWLTPALAYVPIPVLAGLLFFVGISMLREWVWETYFKLPLIEYGLLCVILVLIAAWGLIPGVAFGVLVASALFVYNYSRISCIKHSFSGSTVFSNKERALAEIARLREQGKAARALSLQGYIFFGTSSAVLDACRPLIEGDGIQYLLLDFRMVQGLDVSAVWSFTKLDQLCARNGVTLLLSGLSPALQRVLEQTRFLPQPGIRLFSDLDRGLEWIEDRLLTAPTDGRATPAAEGGEPADLRRIFSEQFRPEVLAALIGYCETLDLAANVPLFRQGDPGDALYMVEQGEVSVLIPLDDGQIKRLRTYGPGTVVGEMAVYSRQPRSADVMTDGPCRLRKLSAESLERMEREHPEVAI